MASTFRILLHSFLKSNGLDIRLLEQAKKARLELKNRTENVEGLIKKKEEITSTGPDTTGLQEAEKQIQEISVAKATKIKNSKPPESYKININFHALQEASLVMLSQILLDPTFMESIESDLQNTGLDSQEQEYFLRYLKTIFEDSTLLFHHKYSYLSPEYDHAYPPNSLLVEKNLCSQDECLDLQTKIKAHEDKRLKEDKYFELAVKNFDTFFKLGANKAKNLNIKHLLDETIKMFNFPIDIRVKAALLDQDSIAAYDIGNEVYHRTMFLACAFDFVAQLLEKIPEQAINQSKSLSKIQNSVNLLKEKSKDTIPKLPIDRDLDPLSIYSYISFDRYDWQKNKVQQLFLNEDARKNFLRAVIENIDIAKTQQIDPPLNKLTFAYIVSEIFLKVQGAVEEIYGKDIANRSDDEAPDSYRILRRMYNCIDDDDMLSIQDFKEKLLNNDSILKKVSEAFTDGDVSSLKKKVTNILDNLTTLDFNLRELIDIVFLYVDKSAIGKNQTLDRFKDFINDALDNGSEASSFHKKNSRLITKETDSIDKEIKEYEAIFSEAGPEVKEKYLGKLISRLIGSENLSQANVEDRLSRLEKLSIKLKKSLKEEIDNHQSKVETIDKEAIEAIDSLISTVINNLYYLNDSEVNRASKTNELIKYSESIITSKLERYKDENPYSSLRNDFHNERESKGNVYKEEIQNILLKDNLDSSTKIAEIKLLYNSKKEQDSFKALHFIESLDNLISSREFKIEKNEGDLDKHATELVILKAARPRFSKQAISTIAPILLLLGDVADIYDIYEILNAVLKYLFKR